MAGEISGNTTAELLEQRLAEQDGLKKSEEVGPLWRGSL